MTSVHDQPSTVAFHPVSADGLTTTTRTYLNVDVDAPFYQIQEHTVWGATAMMISELLTVIHELKID